MSTQYTEIFGRFSIKIKDYTLDKLYVSSVSDYNDYLTGFLLNTIPKFAECSTDLTDRDDTTMVFNNTLTELEEEILANMMALEWAGRETKKLQNMERVLGSNDFKLYSGANSLRENRNLYNDIREEVDALISSYTWGNADIEGDF